MIWYRLACLAFATPSFCEPWMTATERDLHAITIGNRGAISFLAKLTAAGFGGWIGDWSRAIALISCSIRRLTNRDHAHIPHILTHCLSFMKMANVRLLLLCIFHPRRTHSLQHWRNRLELARP